MNKYVTFSIYCFVRADFTMTMYVTFHLNFSSHLFMLLSLWIAKINPKLNGCNRFFFSLFVLCVCYDRTKRTTRLFRSNQIPRKKQENKIYDNASSHFLLAFSLCLPLSFGIRMRNTLTLHVFHFVTRCGFNHEQNSRFLFVFSFSFSSCSENDPQKSAKASVE